VIYNWEQRDLPILQVCFWRLSLPILMGGWHRYCAHPQNVNRKYTSLRQCYIQQNRSMPVVPNILGTFVLRKTSREYITIFCCEFAGNSSNLGNASPKVIQAATLEYSGRAKKMNQMVQSMSPRQNPPHLRILATGLSEQAIIFKNRPSGATWAVIGPQNTRTRGAKVLKIILQIVNI